MIKTGIWTQEDTDLVIASYAARTPVAKIAAQVNRTVAAVEGRLNVLRANGALQNVRRLSTAEVRERDWLQGTRLRTKEMFESGASTGDIARRIGISRRAVEQNLVQLRIRGHIPDNKSADWSEQDMARLKELYATDKPIEQIAQEMRRTRAAVRDKVRVLIQAGETPRRAGRHYWTSSMINQLLGHIDSGVSLTVAAAKMGLDPRQVFHKASALTGAAKRVKRVSVEQIVLPPVEDESQPKRREYIYVEPPLPPAVEIPEDLRVCADYLNGLGRDRYTFDRMGECWVNGLRRVDEQQLRRRAQSFGLAR